MVIYLFRLYEEPTKLLTHFLTTIPHQATGAQLTEGVSKINDNIDKLLAGSSSEGEEGENSSNKTDTDGGEESNSFTARDVADVAGTLSSLSAVFEKDMGTNEQAINQTKILVSV